MQTHNRAARTAIRTGRPAVIFVWGKHVNLVLRGFSHPDFTVGFGISPNQPAFPLARRLRHKRRSLPVLNCTVP